MFTSTIVETTGLLQDILRLCRDNERVFFSHTCTKVRSQVSPWIPSRTSFKTLTRPLVLDKLFDSKNGVYSMQTPNTKSDIYFAMAMMGHTDLHQKGLCAMRWLVDVSSQPFLDTRKIVVTRYFPDNVGEMITKQKMVLYQRLEGSLDKSIVFNDLIHWDLVQDSLFKNTAITKCIDNRTNNQDDLCYGAALNFLSRRNCPIRTLDFSGKVSDETLYSFHRVAWGLNDMAMRNMPCNQVSLILGIISSHPLDSLLVNLHIDGLIWDTGVESSIMETVDLIDVKTLSITNCIFSDRGFVALMSVLSTSRVSKLSFRKSSLSACDVATALFAPSISDSYIVELSLSGVHVPDSVSSTLFASVAGENSLRKLAWAGSDLGHDCVSALVEALKTSSLVVLDVCA